MLGAGQHTEALGTTHGAAVVAMITVWMSFENQNTSNCSLRASGQHRELCEVVGLSSEAWEGEVDS